MRVRISVYHRRLKTTRYVALGMTVTCLVLLAGLCGAEVPERYVTQFGRGAAGAASIAEVLSQDSASEAQILQSLDALTYYGEDGATVLVRFAHRKNGVHRWDLPMVKSMTCVVDKRLVLEIMRIARASIDPEVQVAALAGLGVMVGNSLVDVHVRRGNHIVAAFVSTPSHDDFIRSDGEPIMPADREPIRVFVSDFQDGKKYTQPVRNAALRAERRIDQQERAERKAQFDVNERAAKIKD